jgi:hypothetical protein
VEVFLVVALGEVAAALEVEGGEASFKTKKFYSLKKFDNFFL